MSFFEVPVIKDRKIMKRLDAAAARSSLGAMIAAFAVFAVLCSLGGFYDQHQPLALGYGLLLLLISLFRLALLLRFEAIHGAAPARWRRLFMVGLLAHALFWSALLVTVQRYQDMGFEVLMIYLYLLGIAAALSTSWMSALRFRQLVLVVLLAPAAVISLWQWQPDYGVLALLNFMFMGFMLRVYRQQYRLFWHAYNRERRGPVAASATPALAAADVQLNLVHRLSHEMRTPMNSIIGMLSLLKETPLNEEQQEYHLHASQSSKLMMTLLDDVLDYSQVLTGRLILDPAPFEVRRAFEESLDAYGAAAQQKGVELSCVMSRHLPRRLQADRERLMQVINNLLSNAIKFTQQGEVLMQVELVPINDHEGLLQVAVTDQGIGMSGDEVTQLFRDPSLETAEPLLAGRKGFGLLVCKGIADAMQGNIRVESSPGQGSTFRLAVRVGIQPEMPQQDPIYRFFNRKQAWVVAATAGQFMALSEELAALNFQVARVTDYQAVPALLDAAGTLDDELLVVDGRAGLTQGVALLRQVSAQYPRLKVMFLADIQQRRDSQLQQLIASHSSFEVIVKPVHRREVQQQLRRLYQVPTPVLPEQEKDISSRENRALSKVLLVEDNEINQIVTSGLLSKLGYGFEIASTSRQALNRVENGNFSLILLDCFLPGEDGFQFIRQLRENPRFRETPPVIAMTASTREGIQAQCLAAGMNDFLGKPVRLDELETMLDFWINQQPNDQVEN